MSMQEKSVFQKSPMSEAVGEKTGQPLWRPSPAVISQANLTRFMHEVERRYGIPLHDYWDLDRWAIENRELFWARMFDFGGVLAESRGDTVLEDEDRMPGARWVPQARLNFAENLLRRRDETTALVF